MNFRLAALASALFIALAASQSAPAQDTNFTLNYVGLTDGSSSLNGNPIAPGTSFDIQIGFSTTSEVTLDTGVGQYTPDSALVEVGGTAYSVSPASLSAYAIYLFDSTNPIFPGTLPGYFIPGFQNNNDGNNFSPAYTAATTAGWSATAATATGFTGYVGSGDSLIDFTTSAGALDVDYDAGVGVASSIVADEGNSSVALGLMSIAAIGLGFAISRRRIAAQSPENIHA